MRKKKHIILKNRMEELGRMVSWLETTAVEWNLLPALTLNLNLAMEEAFTNIIHYAYIDQEDHLVEIILEKRKQELKIRMVDDGIPYDPTQKKDPDVTLTAERRNIGGLGIYLIKKTMDKVSYMRKGNKNILSLTKNISPAN